MLAEKCAGRDFANVLGINCSKKCFLQKKTSNSVGIITDKVVIDEALKCKETGEEKTILFGLTGTGYFDLKAYEQFNDGTMTDFIPADEDLQKGFDGIPKFPGNEF